MVYSRIRFKIVQNPFFRKRIYLKSTGSHPPRQRRRTASSASGLPGPAPGSPAPSWPHVPVPAHSAPVSMCRWPALAASPRSRLFKKLTSLLCLGGAPLAGCHGSLWLTGKSSVM